MRFRFRILDGDRDSHPFGPIRSGGGSASVGGSRSHLRTGDGHAGGALGRATTPNL